MKKFICVVLAVMTAFLVACGKGNGGNEGEAAQKGQNEKDKSITIYSLKDDTLCPILTDNDANRQMLGIVYESLVRLKDNLEAEGVLAQDWSVSSDGLIWSFKLRQGVKWHSGESLTPQDVIYTVEQIQKNTGSTYESNIRYIAEMGFSGDSVEFTLNQPCANFVNLMTFPIVHFQGEDIDRASYAPNGTGAYIFSDKNEGNMYYLLRNENWWGGEGKLCEIRVKLLPDSETIMYSLSAGDIDIANTERGQQGRFISNADIKTVSCPMTVYDFLGINHNKGALSQKAVRQAMDKAINRGKIVSDIFAGNGSVARSPIRDNWFVNGDKTEKFDTTSEDAERILLKAEWKKTNGVYGKKTDEGSLRLEFDLLVNDDNSNRMNMAESIKLDLENAGMVINVIPLSYDEYMSRISEGDYELFVGSVMLSEELDFREFLGNGNMFGYESKQLNRLMNETQKAQGKEEIISSYQRFKDRFNAELPVIGICFENFDMLIRENIKGTLKTTQNSIYDGIFNLDLKDKNDE